MSRLVDNPYTTEQEYMGAMEADRPRNVVVNDDRYEAFAEGSQAQYELDKVEIRREVIEEIEKQSWLNSVQVPKVRSLWEEDWQTLKRGEL